MKSESIGCGLPGPVRMWLLLLLLMWATVGAVRADVAGLPASFLVEEGAALSLDEARALYRDGRFQPGRGEVVTFGIGARPVWLRLEVNNPTPAPLALSLVTGTTWIDRIDVHVLKGDALVRQWRSGDTVAGMPGLAPAVGYVLPLEFSSGRSEIYLRAQSPDPMVLAVALTTPEQLEEERRFLGYLYGFLYGFLAALCAYNLLLFVGLGERSYLYYSLSLVSIILCNIAYTGHGLVWWWHDQISFQRYVILLLMVTYSACGLLFASRFLALAEHAPRALRAVKWGSGAVIAATGIGMLLGHQQWVAMMAFSATAAYTVAMFALGVLTVRHGRAAGGYFLAAALCGLIGAALTLLAVWGWLPFTSASYHAVEFGLVLEATLLALALAYQMRHQKQAGLRAEQLARRDPLTEVHNRRAFLELAGPLWAAAKAQGRPLSLVMMDIDHFKQINDWHGHQAGDRVLVEIALLLETHRRQGDILARWGGEEFILLLPDTALDQAVRFAEYLRKVVAGAEVAVRNGGISLTASFGVAEAGGLPGLDELIREADEQMYQAKGQGRDRVCASGADILAPA